MNNNIFNLLYQCEYCSADLSKGKQIKERIIKCSYCGNTNILPKEEQKENVLEYINFGKNKLLHGKFNEAYLDYQEASKIDPTEPEAYFGMALAEHKIRYVKDNVNKKLQPICYEINKEEFKNNKNYQKALQYATVEQKEEYQSRAEEIDIIKDEFFKLEKESLEYDCFFCAKNEDYGMIYKLRDYLISKKGYKIYFAEFDNWGKEGSVYEAAILYALYKAKSMIIFCSNEDYLRTDWVMNEYQRYIEFMEEGIKKEDSLTIVFKDKVIEKLPIENYKKKMQVIDYDDKILSFLVADFINRNKDKNQMMTQKMSFVDIPILENDATKMEKASKGSEIETKITDICDTYLNQVINLREEYEDDPKQFCLEKEIRINGKTITNIWNKANNIYEKISIDNEKNISNLKRLNELISELNYLKEVEIAQKYYAFIDDYPYEEETLETTIKTFKKMDAYLGKTKFNYLKCPFLEEWNSIRSFFKRYTNQQKRNKTKHIFCGIVNSFKLGSPVLVWISSITSILLVVFAWFNLYKFTSYSTSYLIIASITIAIVAIINLKAAYKNRNFQSRLLFIMNIIYSLLPCSMLFLNQIWNINIFMELYVSFILIRTSILILKCDAILQYEDILQHDLADDEMGYCIHIIAESIMTFFILFINSTIINMCNSNVLYTIFYIILGILQMLRTIFICVKKDGYFYPFVNAVSLSYVTLFVISMAFLTLTVSLYSDIVDNDTFAIITIFLFIACFGFEVGHIAGATKY